MAARFQLRGQALGAGGGRGPSCTPGQGGAHVSSLSAEATQLPEPCLAERRLPVGPHILLSVPTSFYRQLPAQLRGPRPLSAGKWKGELWRGQGAFASCRTQELRRVLSLPKAKADAAQRWAGSTGVCTSQDDPLKGWGSPEPPPSSPASPCRGEEDP